MVCVSAVFCCRLKLDFLYEDSRLCVFCTQYFDTDFADYFCYHRGASCTGAAGRIDDRSPPVSWLHACPCLCV